MFKDITVQACMTHPAITVSPTMSIRLAQQLMHKYHIRHLPVVDGRDLVGILSSGDVRRASPSNATTLSVWEMRFLWDKIKVEEVMSRYVITVKPDTSMLEAVKLMYEHRFNSLPVVDDAGQLVGILTEIDVYLFVIRSSEEARVESPLPSNRPVLADS